MLSLESPISDQYAWFQVVLCAKVVGGKEHLPRSEAVLLVDILLDSCCPQLFSVLPLIQPSVRLSESP